MAYQPVDLGSSPNDDTGDPLRDAFDKINDNFIENGSWTPVLRGKSVAGTQTYSVQTGRYRAIGGMVFAFFDIELSAFDGATSGSMEISGLPFANLANVRGAVDWSLITSVNLATNYTMVIGNIPTSTSAIDLMEGGDNVTHAALTEADFGNTSNLIGVAIYERAAP